MFVDNARIYIKAGDGGNGAVSFHREKYVPNGGPDGGDGGNGGSIIFAVNEGMRTLADFRHKIHYRAENGGNGQGRLCRGKDGDDLIIEVPPGTVIKDVETGRVIADLYRPGDRKVILRGGKGGKGNARFATATRQTPKFAQPGEKTEERCVSLELKIIADVGLIGFPNVGKSTILSVLTSARPKIANYHFTTIAPNLGVVEYEGKSFVLADIPGLIEGAHQGVGLGHEFLRHVERTRVFIHVVDISGSEGRDPVEDFFLINEELRHYNEELLERPTVIIANKMDIPGSEENLERFRKSLDSDRYKVFPASAVAHKGLTEAVREVMHILDNLPPAEPLVEEDADWFDVRWGEEEDVHISIEDGVYVVSGKLVDKIIRSVNFEDVDSMNYFQRVLRKRGIIDALKEKGIKDGDTVRMEDIEFDFVE